MTDEQFQSKVLSALSGISVQMSATHAQVKRLESAVLGNPDEGVDGLLTRQKVVEATIKEIAEKTPGKARRAAINAGAGLSGAAVFAFFTTEIWPFIKAALAHG